jgi:hypothetical protein
VKERLDHGVDPAAADLFVGSREDEQRIGHEDLGHDVGYGRARREGFAESPKRMVDPDRPVFIRTAVRSVNLER